MDVYRTYTDMENNLYGIYDAVNDKPNYLRHSVDDQYNNNVRLGAMLNLTFLSKDGNHKYQLKNIFNQLATSRYTWRDGVSAQSNLERSAEYYYRSRTTYNGQFTGKHTFTSDALDWSIGYDLSEQWFREQQLDGRLDQLRPTECEVLIRAFSSLIHSEIRIS